jgi:hypothetical protein
MTTSMDRATAAPGQVTAMIASPLEPEHATAIAATFPDRVELIYRPDLMPPMRYVADHHGDPARLRTPAQQREWHALLARAEVLWDFAAKEDQGPLALSPNLRWVQTTSAGVGQYVMDLGLQGSDIVVTTASGIHARPAPAHSAPTVSSPVTTCGRCSPEPTASCSASRTHPRPKA